MKASSGRDLAEKDNVWLDQASTDGALGSDIIHDTFAKPLLQRRETRISHDATNASGFNVDFYVTTRAGGGGELVLGYL